MGSKLSEHVLGEIEIIEKRNSNSNNHPVIIEPLTAMGAEVLPPPPNQPRKVKSIIYNDCPQSIDSLVAYHG